MNRRTAKLLSLCVMCVCSAQANGASFQSLGFQGVPHGISNSGAVVGHAGSWGSGTQAFLWTSEIGGWSLGNLSGDQYDNVAWGVSADGSTIVGESGNAQGRSAFRWTLASGMQPLVATPGLSSSATAVSADGCVIVGSISDSSNRWQPFRWSASDGAEIINEVQRGEAIAVSADGTVVVGTHARNGGWEPYRWTAAGGLELLGRPGGDTAAWARVASADGNTIAGKAEPLDQAFRWTPSDGTVRLGPITGPAYTVWNWQEVYGISADGSTIVGRAFLGDLEYAAFIWDADHGMRILQDVLQEDYGLHTEGWYIPVATAISPDGTIIGGYGYDADNQMQAWVAVIPEPSCLGWLAVVGLALGRRREG